MSDYTGLFQAGSYNPRNIVDIKGNVARVYIDKAPGQDLDVTVYDAIKSYKSKRLAQDYTHTIVCGEPKPEVKLPLKGSILPDAGSLVIPFKAINLSAVDLSIIKIYEDNMLMFLQDNGLEGGEQLRRSGRLEHRQTIRLDADRDLNLKEWNDFSIDLGGIIRQEPGALYRIRLSFKQDYSLYGRQGIEAADGLVSIKSGQTTQEEMEVWDSPYAYYYEDFYDWSTYRWSDRDDP